MRIVTLLRACLVLFLVSGNPLSAMPPMSDEVGHYKTINPLIEKQTAHWQKRNFKEALIVNKALVAKLKSLKSEPLDIAQAEIDQAIILFKNGNDKAALIQFKALHHSGRLDMLFKQYNSMGQKGCCGRDGYLEYYLHVYHGYLEVLKKAKDPTLLKTASAFITKVEAARTQDMPKITTAGITSYVLNLAEEQGAHAMAKRICNNNLRWLSSVNPDAHKYPGYLSTVFTNDEYVYDWALKIKDLDDHFKKDYFYAFAEAYDDCAALLERNGDGETALKYRILSRGLIVKSSQAKYTGLIDMRIGRLFSFLGRPEEAASYLQRAWQGDPDVPSGDRALLCDRLKFDWKGTAISAAKVKENWASAPETAFLVSLYDCPGL
jgi:tetratricopeptide (TPR) repeat protein